MLAWPLGASVLRLAICFVYSLSLRTLGSVSDIKIYRVAQFRTHCSFCTLYGHNSRPRLCQAVGRLWMVCYERWATRL